MDAAFCWSCFSLYYFFETDVVFLSNLPSNIEKNTLSNKSNFKYNLNICLKLDSMLFIPVNKLMSAIKIKKET